MSRRWTKGVELNIARSNVYRTIHTTADAADYLLHMRPIESGEGHCRAHQMYLAVLEGRRRADDAREAFIAAEEEAGLFVRSLCVCLYGSKPSTLAAKGVGCYRAAV